MLHGLMNLVIWVVLVLLLVGAIGPWQFVIPFAAANVVANIVRLDAQE